MSFVNNYFSFIRGVYIRLIANKKILWLTNKTLKNKYILWIICFSPKFMNEKALRMNLLRSAFYKRLRYFLFDLRRACLPSQGALGKRAGKTLQAGEEQVAAGGKGQ